MWLHSWTHRFDGRVLSFSDDPIVLFLSYDCKKDNIQKMWGIKETSREWTMNCNDINSNELRQVVNNRNLPKKGTFYLTRFICYRCLTTANQAEICLYRYSQYETSEVTKAYKTTTTKLLFRLRLGNNLLQCDRLKRKNDTGAGYLAEKHKS